MRLQFWGAARQVTGSMHQITLDSGYTILIDCGLQYERGEALELNTYFPFDPAQIDLIILTHAHIDHSGNIPTLIQKGYTGQILCTEPTAALAENLLTDSVNVQLAESKSRHKNKKSGKYQKASLYGQKDVLKTIDRLVTLPFHKWFSVNSDIRFMFYPAGHILGAASVLLEITENSQTKRIGFTGDLGKNNSKIVVDAEPMPNLDYLVSECTYGNRDHKASLEAEDEIYTYVKKNCIDQRGRLVIPAFSVGRTQAILFTLNQLYVKGKLDGITVFTDSKLGIASTLVHDEYADYLNEETKSFYKQNGDLFSFPSLRVIQTESDQKEMAYQSGPTIIVSSAGMIEGGRIQQHIRNNIQNPACTILIAGFCAEGTLGYRLLQGQPTVKIKNKESPIYARIASTDVFSAHPDKTGLLTYLKSSYNKNLKNIYLVHGEESSMLDFAEFLRENIDVEIVTPQKGDAYNL